MQLAPFAAGTLSGMAAWCSVYGTLGGAGRSVLKQGTSLDALLAGMNCHAFFRSPFYTFLLICLYAGLGTWGAYVSAAAGKQAGDL